MEKVLERYERYSYAERQLKVPDFHVNTNWSMEYSRLKDKIELLERNQRHYLGEDLESISLKELQNLEQHLDTALKHIRSRKEKEIQEENSMLAKQIKEREGILKTHQNQWEQQTRSDHIPSQQQLQLHPYMTSHQTAHFLNMGGLCEGQDPTAVRRNNLDLTLEPIYNCNLGCFAT
ncbi:unnamed protein product [Microthlaspi erraticum]|uniref:K-box domain-containing protein n=1 Tax=Microthlaspi erraticum TaxID=1685480 RepID=A0A6D2J949_9BRAS|nr:unnamed protein product [Microthlaspi erraticum]